MPIAAASLKDAEMAGDQAFRPVRFFAAVFLNTVFFAGDFLAAGFFGLLFFAGILFAAGLAALVFPATALPALFFFAAFFGLDTDLAAAGLALIEALLRAARVLAARADLSSASNSAGVNGRADLRSLSMS
jgi:hypothetical protein